MSVDVEDIAVPDRTERLLAAGVPDHTPGRPLCGNAWNSLRRSTRLNYRKLTFLDRLLGHPPIFNKS